ncbi:MAG: permease, partial [Smithellaceae bacterium]
ETSCCAASPDSHNASKSKPAAAACCSSDSAQPLTLITLPTVETSSCCSVNLEPIAAPPVPFRQKLKNASIAAVDTFKGVFWYLLLGAAIGAFIYGFFPQDIVVKLAGPGNPWSIPIAALIGVPMYIRAETIIPIAAALVGKGMGLGTVLALIIGGAGASIPELIILSSMFKRKLIIAFALNVLVIAVLAGYLVDIFLS